MPRPTANPFMFITFFLLSVFGSLRHISLFRNEIVELEPGGAGRIYPTAEGEVIATPER